MPPLNKGKNNRVPPKKKFTNKKSDAPSTKEVSPSSNDDLLRRLSQDMRTVRTMVEALVKGQRESEVGNGTGTSCPSVGSEDTQLSKAAAK